MDLAGHRAGHVHRSGANENQPRIDPTFTEKLLFLGKTKRHDRSLYRRIPNDRAGQR
jgi:hypothetical protein